MENLRANFSEKLTIGKSKQIASTPKALPDLIEGETNSHLNDDLNWLLRIIPFFLCVDVYFHQTAGKQSDLNQDMLKFLREIDYIKCKLGAFDAKKINIAVWFEQFECLTEMLGWVNEQRIDSLVHLLGPALDRLSQEKRKSKILDKYDNYEITKMDIINLVDQLLIIAPGYLTMYEHLVQNVMRAFNTKDFTNPEIRYWLGCIASPEYYSKLCAELRTGGRQKKLQDLLSLVNSSYLI